MPASSDSLSNHITVAAIPFIWFLNYLNLLEWRFKKLVRIRREIDRFHFPPRMGTNPHRAGKFSQREFLFNS